MKNESSYRSKICSELRTLGCLVIPLVGTAAGGSGYPDTYICSTAVSFFIEFKGKETKLRPQQQRVLRLLRDKGDIAYVLRDPGILEDENGIFFSEIKNGFRLLKYIRENHKERSKL